MKDFVSKDSIVRKIWGKGDTILFIFAGAAAEFALSKAVDWLYFTGRLPSDPLGRLFSTVTYARKIVFSEYDAALEAIDQITAIHKNIESSRGSSIPDWAYRDVLFMLIDYSIVSFEVLERKLNEREKNEVFNVFYHVGQRMGISDFPLTYPDWEIMRNNHLQQNLLCSHFTLDLYKQYRKHLGLVRYYILKKVQALITPKRVNNLLSLGDSNLITAILYGYKSARLVGLDQFLRNLLLPKVYKDEVQNLDIA